MKKERLRRGEKKRGELREKLLKRKLTERWLQLPEKEKEKFRREEERKN